MDLANEFMSMAGCSGLESCRDLTPAQIKKASTDAGKNVMHPIKLVLEPGFGPVVDGNYIPGNFLQIFLCLHNKLYYKSTFVK